jgi:uncharacterized protein
VPNPRKPLRLNVGFLVSGPIGTGRDFDFDFEHFQVSDDLSLDDFVGFAKISRTPQGLLVEGNFSARIELECVRCLIGFNQPIHFDFTELYAFNSKSVTESGLMVPEDAQIDLQPLVREYALLEFPISPIHDPHCKGLCPVCGQDLNQRDCGHRPEADDSSFDVLRNLLDDL